MVGLWVVAVIVGVVIIGGIKGIAKVTDKIVPIMCGVYVLAAIIVLGGNLDKIPSALKAIITGFDFDAIYGGFLGVLIIGVQRAAFSNEAGVEQPLYGGKTNYPANEGIVALLEPFIDTVVVCAMTALVIIVTGEYLHFDGGGTEAGNVNLSCFCSGYKLVSTCFNLAVVLFAFSTMISWCYYEYKHGNLFWKAKFQTSPTS